MTAPIVLVDGSSYLYRAYHAMPPFSTRTGQPTGAIKGVINMLQTLLKTYKPEHIAVVFDASGPTFRDEIYPEYKAHRPPMPDDLRAQIEPLHTLIRAMGLPLLCEQGVEADDVIGTLATHATQQGLDILISTGDKDMAQLVNQHVTLINTMTNTLLNREGVIEKFGIPPESIIDYLALVGDSADNIPGVAGVGPKTAVKWLQEYHSIDGIIQHAESIKGKVGENLRASLDTLALARQLATIKCDVSLPLSLQDLHIGQADHEQLLVLTHELEFKTWHNDLTKNSVAIADEPDNTRLSEKDNTQRVYHTIFTESEFKILLDKLNHSAEFCVDTETTNINYMKASIVGLSFCLTPFEAYYIPFAHDYMGAPDQLNKQEVLAQLKPILENPSIGKIGQHLKYDVHVFANEGIFLQGICYDTMLASYVLDATATRHNMDDLAKFYLQEETVKFEDIAGKGTKQLTFNQIPIGDAEQPGAAYYAAEDADITLRLAQHFRATLHNTPTLENVLSDIEIPVSRILQKMEHYGTLIDTQMLAQQSKAIGEKLLILEKKAYELAGQEFNLQSPKQLAHILYEKLAIPAPKKTATGQYSTAEDVLEQLEHPLPQLLLEHRSLAKLKSTYTDKLPELIDHKTRRIHTSYHQAVAATGRLSSSDPNLQNIPIRTEEGRKIRQAFIAPKGFKLVAADYSQIELRIMAHLSSDPGLVNAFQSGEDVHKATASEVFSVPLHEVSTEQRRNAKAINFGLIYGMSAFGLAKQLGISRQDAQAYVDMYFERYPGVKTYMERTRFTAHDQGYVETLWGRRLYLRDINAKNPMLRQGAERAAINAPMQGTAADIIKKAMIAVEQTLGKYGDSCHLLMQVHDELVFEVAEDNLDAICTDIKIAMESAANLSVPLVVDIGIGNNWDEAH